MLSNEPFPNVNITAPPRGNYEANVGDGDKKVYSIVTRESELS